MYVHMWSYFLIVVDFLSMVCIWLIHAHPCRDSFIDSLLFLFIHARLFVNLISDLVAIGFHYTRPLWQTYIFINLFIYEWLNKWMREKVISVIPVDIYQRSCLYMDVYKNQQKYNYKKENSFYVLHFQFWSTNYLLYHLWDGISVPDFSLKDVVF